MFRNKFYSILSAVDDKNERETKQKSQWWKKQLKLRWQDLIK